MEEKWFKKHIYCFQITRLICLDFHSHNYFPGTMETRSINAPNICILVSWHCHVNETWGYNSHMFINRMGKRLSGPANLDFSFCIQIGSIHSVQVVGIAQKFWRAFCEVVTGSKTWRKMSNQLAYWKYTNISGGSEKRERCTLPVVAEIVKRKPTQNFQQKGG